MKHQYAVLAITLLCPMTTALAGPFVVGSGVYTDHNVGGLSKPLGGAVTAGYEAEDVPLFVEAEFYLSGKFGFDGDKNLSSRGGAGFVGAALPFSEHFRVLLKAGYYSIKTEADGGGSITDKDFAVGGGVEIMFTEQFGIRAEVENAIYDNAKDSQLYKFGLTWRPPSGYRRYDANPTAAPYTPAVAADYVAPAATVAPSFKPGDEALARPGSSLRATPQESAEVVQSLSPSPLLKLESSIVNATGEWWFVSTDVERGWLRGDELIKP